MATAVFLINTRLIVHFLYRVDSYELDALILKVILPYKETDYQNPTNKHDPL